MQCAAGGAGEQETRSATIPASASSRAAAPGRPQPGPARRGTRRAFVLSTPAQAGMEPRRSLLS
jgi:hypothetical protein